MTGYRRQKVCVCGNNDAFQAESALTVRKMELQRGETVWNGRAPFLRFSRYTGCYCERHDRHATAQITVGVLTNQKFRQKHSNFRHTNEEDHRSEEQLPQSWPASTRRNFRFLDDKLSWNREQVQSWGSDGVTYTVGVSVMLVSTAGIIWHLVNYRYQTDMSVSVANTIQPSVNCVYHTAVLVSTAGVTGVSVNCRCHSTTLVWAAGIT